MENRAQTGNSNAGPNPTSGAHGNQGYNQPQGGVTGNPGMGGQSGAMQHGGGGGYGGGMPGGGMQGGGMQGGGMQGGGMQGGGMQGGGMQGMQGGARGPGNMVSLLLSSTFTIAEVILALEPMAVGCSILIIV